jgi:hypothetical protein
MTPILSTCGKCVHPAIKAAKQCRKAMELANASKPGEIEAMLRTAMDGLRQSKLPMMRAKILNSLGLVYAQQSNHDKARCCLSLSLRIIERHVA